MRRVSVLFAAALLLAVCGMSKSAEARSRVSFGYYGSGFSFYVGPRPHYYYRPYYYRPYYYRPYYYRPYYAPRRSYSSRCSKWRYRCRRNWGYGGRNYRGCLRYHRCR